VIKIPIPPLSLHSLRRASAYKTQIYLMEQEKKSTAVWWLVFLASTAALLFAIYTHWEWLTLLLPFVATSFVKAMRLM
jgi:1,4-dihydroxy-2-naphthoate octaprenyltransferase